MSTLLSSAVSTVGKAVRSVANSVRDWNTSTLSGAVDVIVVRRKSCGDFVYCSTPFHVKFGMFQVMKSSDHMVSIEINGDKNPLKMKLSRNGYAYFAEDRCLDDVSAGSSSVDDTDEKCDLTAFGRARKFKQRQGSKQSDIDREVERSRIKAQRRRNLSENRRKKERRKEC